jgi:hypothetical protein
MVVDVTHSSASGSDGSSATTTDRDPPPAPDARAGRERVAWAVAVGGLVGIALALMQTVERINELLALVISALSAVGTLLAVPWISTRLTKARLPSLASRPAMILVRVALAAELVVAVVWLGVRYHQWSSEIDVLDRVTPQELVNVSPGAEVEVEVPVSAVRSSVAVTIEITDHNPDGGICAPFTTVAIRQAHRAIHGSPRTAHSGERVTISTPRTGERLRLGIAVGNQQGDRNCAVDLRISSARLTNDD